MSTRLEQGLNWKDLFFVWCFPRLLLISDGLPTKTGLPTRVCFNNNNNNNIFTVVKPGKWYDASQRDFCRS
jgi:hypothetical protein